MTARRDLLIGTLCIVGAGVVHELKPRRKISLQGAAKLEQFVPRAFGEWTSRDVSDLVAPTTPDSLMAKLYEETVGRVYTHGSSHVEIMMLLAHGDTQSNDLQLHRPEVCYPAFGYAITNSQPIELPLPGNVSLPARRLVAIAPERQENIIYWSRLGEHFPINGEQQRLDRLSTAMHGFVADGLLARFSMLSADSRLAFNTTAGFIGELVRTVPADKRLGLIGTERAGAMAGARV